jgi:hypothetical protein
MMPSAHGPEATPPTHDPAMFATAAPGPVYRWYHRLFAVLVATFCLVIGITLLIYPWTSWWEDNYFVGLTAFLRRYWNNLYLKGAISGIGVVNLYISLIEVFRLKRFSQR